MPPPHQLNSLPNSNKRVTVHRSNKRVCPSSIEVQALAKGLGKHHEEVEDQDAQAAALYFFLPLRAGDLAGDLLRAGDLARGGGLAVDLEATSFIARWYSIGKRPDWYT